MTQEQFLKLVRQGEKSNVDFKLVCNAFNSAAGDYDKAKAELVKDVCAMANNGSNTSYLIVGVGDDRKTVQPVHDVNLSSQNIQSLIRDSIHPRPVVRVHRVKWAAAPKPFAGVQFVVIQVGPNARQAFRLTRDMINFSKKIHFRKHEVWVRNEDTSDLATPEQIARLLGIRSAQAEPEPDFRVTEYQKLAFTDQLPALSQDAKDFFIEMGAKFGRLPASDNGRSWTQGGFRAALRIRNKPFVVRCEFRRTLTSNTGRFSVKDHWMCEHGVFIFVINTFTDAGKPGGLVADSKTGWGSLGIFNPKYNSQISYGIPTGLQARAGALTLSRLSDTRVLRKKLGELFVDLQSDDALFGHLDEARDSLNQLLRIWRRKSVKRLRADFPEYSTVKPVRLKQQVQSLLKLAKLV